MARRYFVAPLPPPGPGPLPQDVGHHVANVLRRAVGDEVVLFDGTGREAVARLTEIGRGGKVLADFGAATRPPLREPAARIEVAVALPKGQRADWLLEHGTEVGIAAFRPLLTQRSANRLDRISARWHRILTAAAGQCDRSLLPTLHPPATWSAFLADDLPAARFFADGDGPPLEPMGTGTAVLAVGPEGGWTAAEREAALAHGFEPRSLGPLTLRTETAALVGAARLLA